MFLYLACRNTTHCATLHSCTLAQSWIILTTKKKPLRKLEVANDHGFSMLYIFLISLVTVPCLWRLVACSCLLTPFDKCQIQNNRMVKMSFIPKLSLVIQRCNNFVKEMTIGIIRIYLSFSKILLFKKYNEGYLPT